jgi:hypothetical protein
MPNRGRGDGGPPHTSGRRVGMIRAEVARHRPRTWPAGGRPRPHTTRSLCPSPPASSWLVPGGLDINERPGCVDPFGTADCLFEFAAPAEASDPGRGSGAGLAVQSQRAGSCWRPSATQKLERLRPRPDHGINYRERELVPAVRGHGGQGTAVVGGRRWREHRLPRSRGRAITVGNAGWEIAGSTLAALTRATSRSPASTWARWAPP